MAPTVCKFGGSSLADAGMIRKVADIVRADPRRRYVVPSAPGKRSPDDRKITDLLYLCHEAATQKLAFDEAFGIVADRYRGIVADLGLDLDIDSHLDTVRRDVAGGESADYAASRGEFLNGLIVAEAIDSRFVDAAELIAFDARGRLDEERTYAMIAERLGGLERAVVPGFYGRTPDGSIKTFSRGGSDITGAIIVRGVGAGVYENWTDVSGLLMADPRVVSDPRKIDTITYRELRELSYSGATVLHDEAVFPVRAAGIPVNIRNTNDPHDGGTMIIRTGADPEGVVGGSITGIAGRKDFTVITVEKAMMNAEVGYGRRLLSVLEGAGINFEHMPSGIDTMSVVIADAELNGKVDAVLEQIRAECHPESIDVDANMALIATVGRGMSHTPGTAAKLFSALADAGVNIRMMDQGSSELNIIVGVNVDDFERACRAIYSAFVA